MLQFHNIGNVEDVVYFGGGGFLYLLYWQLPVNGNVRCFRNDKCLEADSIKTVN